MSTSQSQVPVVDTDTISIIQRAESNTTTVPNQASSSTMETINRSQEFQTRFQSRFELPKRVIMIHG